MATLSTVDFWPATGWPDQPWAEEPELDAWVKSARRVCELYSAAIVGHRLQASASGLRLTPHSSDSDEVVVGTFAESTFEGATVDVPEQVVELTPLARAKLVLEAIDLAMRQLAPMRGWPLDALAAAKQQVLDSGLCFSWTGREVRSRDRRRVARTQFTLADDGYGRVEIEVENTSTGEIAVAGPFLAYSTIEGFRRTSKSLRWVDRDHLSLVAFNDAFGIKSVTTEVDLTSDLSRRPRVEPQVRPARRVFAISVPLVVLPPPPGPRITGGSGGPMNDVPPLYDAATLWLYENIPAAVTAWWAESGLLELNVTYTFWGDMTGIRLHRRGDDLAATMSRPMPDDEATRDPIGVAYRDVTDVLEAVRRRSTLPPAPTLPRPTPADLEEHVRRAASPETPEDLDELLADLPPEIRAALAQRLNGLGFGQ